MTDFNFDIARHNMVESQVRTWEVQDQAVLDLLAHAPRQAFVPEKFHNLAYADMQIPLGHGQVMLTPTMEGRLLQALEVNPQDKILEVGTGSGYMTWLLASLAAQVYSVEIIPEFKTRAAEKLHAQGIRNANLEIGDAACGWDRHAPYDGILVTGSLPVMQDSFRQSLAVGGRLVVIVGSSPVMQALLIRRIDEQTFTQESLFETHLPALINAPEPNKFVF